MKLIETGKKSSHDFVEVNNFLVILLGLFFYAVSTIEEKLYFYTINEITLIVKNSQKFIKICRQVPMLSLRMNDGR